jgi:hypothetical protein
MKPPSQKLKLFLALGMLGLAAVFFRRSAAVPSRPAELAYFYDEGERALFPAPRNLLAPVSGWRKPGSVAVRAIVIAANGDPEDKAARRIAYLEKYSPELKAALEAARSGQAGAPPRQFRQDFTLVRRPDESDWHAISSREGKAILVEWQTPGPDGKRPTICSP